MPNIKTEKYFLILFSLIPISIITGALVSLINITLIAISFLFILILNKEFKIFKNNVIICFFVLYLYLIFNSFIALDLEISLKRNFGFIRYILLFLAINYFFINSDFKNNVLKFWGLVLSVLLIDSYVEIINGKNILGFGGDVELYGRRLVSFFKDEPIVGSFLNAFYLIIGGFFFQSFNNYSIQRKSLICIFIVLCVLCIILSGERSNSIKAVLGFILFLLVNKNIKMKIKLMIFVSLIFISTILFNKIEFLKTRYGIITPYDRIETIKNNVYFKLYNSAFEIFKDYPLLGIGNKNYRIEACEKEKVNPIFFCNTHPHQIYFEFLSEHGVIGTSIILIIFFFLLFKILKVIFLNKEKNYVQVGCFIYLTIVFIPFLPSGSFFADFNANLFWINFSIMYAVNKKTNIFSS